MTTLPLTLPPRGLSRTGAAAYIDISPTLFDEMARDGRMPGPKHINARRIWDRFAIDRAFDALPGGEEPESVNPWDEPPSTLADRAGAWAKSEMKRSPKKR